MESMSGHGPVFSVSGSRICLWCRCQRGSRQRAPQQSVPVEVRQCAWTVPEALAALRRWHGWGKDTANGA